MIKKIAPDKWKHFFVGIPLGGGLLFACYTILDLSGWLATVVAFLGLTGICYGFELFSLVTGKGHYEFMDAVAGIIGGGLGMAVLWLILK